MSETKSSPLASASDLKQGGAAGMSEQVFSSHKTAQVSGLDSPSVHRAKLKRAQSEIDFGQYADARDHLRELVAAIEQHLASDGGDAQPDIGQLYASALTALGRACERLKEKEEAGAAFSRAAATFGRWPPSPDQSGYVHSDYGIALFKTGHKEEAVEKFRQAREKGDVSAEAYRYFGVGLWEQGQAWEAEKCFRTAIELDPGDCLAHRALAELLEKQEGRRDEALAEYWQAITLMANFGMTEEALDTLERYLALDPDNVLALAARGDMLRVAGRGDEAMQSVERALTKDPDNVLALATRGQLLHEKGLTEEAVKDLERALKLDPGFDWSQKALGSAYLDLGLSDAALKVLGQYLSGHADDVEALGLQALALGSAGRDKEALEVFRRAAELAPASVWLQIEMGKTYGKVEDYAEYLNSMDRALALDPNNVQALALRGDALRLLERPKEALPSLDAALEIDPENAFVLGTKGQVLRALGQTADAVEVLRRAAERGPQLDWVLEELSAALYESDLYDEALATLDNLLKLKPDSVVAWRYKSATLMMKERYEESLEAIEQSLKLDPENAWALGQKGFLLRRAGEAEAAVAALRRSAEISPKYDWVYVELGLAQSSLGAPAEALEAFEQALALRPNNVLALVYKADMLRVLGRLDDALQAAEQALALSPDDALAMGVKGQVLHGQERYEEAAGVLQRAVSLDPDLAWTQAELGTVLFRLNRHEEALEAINGALEKEQDFYWAYVKGSILGDMGEYAAAVEALDLSLELDPAKAQSKGEYSTLRGWCHFRVGEHDGEDYRIAERHFTDALSVSPESVSDQFNLALTMLCAGRREAGLREYELGMKMVASKPPPLRHGMILVARDDLEVRARALPGLADDVAEALQILSGQQRPAATT